MIRSDVAPHTVDVDRRWTTSRISRWFPLPLRSRLLVSDDSLEHAKRLLLVAHQRSTTGPSVCKRLPDSGPHE